MENSWPEVLQAHKESRHELILSGNKVSERITKSGFPSGIFSLTALNLLVISDTCLDAVPDGILQLVNLQTLLLHSNKIQRVPAKLDELIKLKTLDLSGNALTQLPDHLFEKCSQLTVLNLSNNKLVALPGLEHATKLSVLDAANNELAEFPHCCYATLTLLAEVKLNGNCITVIPPEINAVSALKLLDLAANKIAEVPGELADLAKLKDLNLKDNPIADRRFLKLIAQSRTTKQVIDYIRQHCPRTGSPDAKASSNKKAGKKQRHRQGSGNETTDAAGAEGEADGPSVHVIKISRTTDADKPPDVRVREIVKTVRAHILCCVIHNVQFDDQSLKRFIQLQTKLHEMVCEKRNAATIATHDLNKVATGDLVYGACAPGELVIKPLARAGEMFTGAKLFELLRNEAEAHRKEKKRNSYSGIHRYLYLLEGKAVYPFLMDSTQKIISFPPITNSDDTKISIDTKSILVEVTSATSQDVCRKVLDSLLRETLLLGIGESTEDNDHHLLTLQRVKICDIEGNMKAVYPSKTDLNMKSDILKVVRE